ncbi:hypothetical protein ACW7GZ_02820 [Luteimonas sp. A537]
MTSWRCVATMVLAFAAEATAASATEYGPAATEPATVRVSGERLHFVGGIDLDAVARVRGLLEASPQVREVVVNSVGGDVEAGMHFGNMINARGLDVRVSGDVCLSSCANYVFPAGRRKTIESGTLVLWHGSLIQDGLFGSFDLSRAEAQLGRPLSAFERWQVRRFTRAWLREAQEMQARFYERLGVDPRITVIGQQQGCRCDWTLSITDMAAMGVVDVSAPDDYASPGYGHWPHPWQRIDATVDPPDAR